MEKYRLERSEYWFDPTATKAVARVDRKPSTPPTGDIYHASAADIAKFAESIFEPTKLISKGQIRRDRYLMRVLNQK